MYLLFYICILKCITTHAHNINCNYYTENTTTESTHTISTTVPTPSTRSTTPYTTEPNLNSPGRCEDSQWQCHNGDCIDAAYKCDGAVDCSDESDEGPECPGNTIAGSSIATTTC